MNEASATNRLFLAIHITSYWAHGTGGGGEDYDSVIFRDADGLPALKGRHVAGLLREACRRVEGWGHVPMEWDSGRHGTLTELLFGKRNNRLAPEGLLSFPAAFRLPPRVRNLSTEHRPLFSRGIASTRLEHESGVAFDYSLRNMEAAVPATLGGWIDFDPAQRLAMAHDPATEKARIAAAQGVWQAFLHVACVEVRAVGGKRTRGFGRCRLQVITGATAKKEREGLAA